VLEATLEDLRRERCGERNTERMKKMELRLRFRAEDGDPNEDGRVTG